MIFLFSIPGGGEILLLLLIIGFISLIFYLLMLQRLLQAVSPENRLVSPGTVWVVLFPIFGFIIHFILVFIIAVSVSKEAQARQMMISQKHPGLPEGIFMCAFSCLEIIPSVKYIAAAGFLISWIFYWVKMNQYLKLLTEEVKIQR